jgi:hypothetical protein
VQGAGPEDLVQARARWAAAGVDDYAFTIHRSCFCPPEYTGPFRMTVRDGEIASVTRAGRPVDAVQVQVPAVDDLFDQLEAAYAAGAATVRVTYDAGMGHPVEIWIDLDEAMADEETGYTISDLVVN